MENKIKAFKNKNMKHIKSINEFFEMNLEVDNFLVLYLSSSNIICLVKILKVPEKCDNPNFIKYRIETIEKSLSTWYTDNTLYYDTINKKYYHPGGLSENPKYEELHKSKHEYTILWEGKDLTEAEKKYKENLETTEISWKYNL